MSFSPFGFTLDSDRNHYVFYPKIGEGSRGGGRHEMDSKPTASPGLESNPKTTRN